jgi:hypothetical protein
MGSFKHPRAFDPLDLEIINRVYEATWALVEALKPLRDHRKDDEQKKALRKRVMTYATSGEIEFDDLYHKVWPTMIDGA